MSKNVNKNTGTGFEVALKMEALPLIPKPKVLPNLDAAPFIREIFQEEFQTVVPTEKLSQNILTTFEYRRKQKDEPDSYRSVEFPDNLPNRGENIIGYTENVLEAHKNHQEKLDEIKEAEKHLFETHADFLEREKVILEDPTFRQWLSLKRQPLFKSLDPNYVRKYKLLQGDAGLPPEPEVKSDFRVKNFKKWRKKLDNISNDNAIMNFLNKTPTTSRKCKLPKKRVLREKFESIQKSQKTKPKSNKPKEKPVFSSDPKVVFFTDFKLGDIYLAEIKVKNIHDKTHQFQLKPMCADGPFRVMLSGRCTTTITSGLIFHLNVEFTPKSLDNAAEDIIIVTEDGNRFLIPLIAYLEPPILKTHKEVDEFTRVTSERIMSSYIDCGACFTGDTKVTKLKFRCYRGSGEFFIMSSENWSRSYINTVTVDNLLEIPPFRVYPVFFKIEKGQVIDLFVEFIPKNSGTHVENIIIACDNGQIRSLDLIGDAAGWHSYYFSFQDSLLKELSVEEDDDMKVKYYLDFEDTATNGKVEKVFCVSNNSNMSFDFQWKIREANILSSQEKYMRLSKDQVKIDPESGTFEPNSIWEFLVTITFSKAEIGNYRMVLSLYVLNLPYQCIEEDNTIIQPTGFVRNLYSQSLYGEEESSALSPELASLQGTYESLQESIKSYVEYQNKTQTGPRLDFCRTTCIPNPGLCAKPLKKSKTFFNIGENIEDTDGHMCACRHKPEAESNSESCPSNSRDDRVTEMSPKRNEVIWDFVDVLVEEVELWVEVSPTRVTLEPSVIQLDRPLHVHEHAVFKEIRVINHNQSPINCSWLLPSEVKGTNKNSSSSGNGNTSFALLFDKKFGTRKEQNSKDSLIAKQHHSTSCGLSEQEEENKPFEADQGNRMSEPCNISTKPQKSFTVGGLSDFTCKIGISARQPGKIQELLCLYINEGELKLNVLILGTAVVKSIDTSPDILDFGIIKQGTRYTKDFVISNKSSNSLQWRINQFQFDFKKEKFLGQSEIRATGHLKNIKGTLMKKENSTTESCCLDARVPGIKCSLLEVQNNNGKPSVPEKQYILVLGDVRLPELWLSSPRFENAILAPSGRMYVGHKINTKVTLTNVGSVGTFFTWGNPFGCHSRKIKVDISPKSCSVEKEKKVTVSVELTALDEGIISHCYIPCFFCRSAKPLILSIVGVAESVNVTFEIIDYPMQAPTDNRTFRKSPLHHTLLRVSWPVKTYNPTLSMKYIHENDVQNLMCRCQEVEEEAAQAFGLPKDSIVADVGGSEKSVRSLKSFEINGEGTLESKSSIARNSSVRPEEEVLNSFLGEFSNLETKKSEENSLISSSYYEPSLENLQTFNKPQLEFLNVPYQTPTHRQFAIRNETAIETSFQISILTYGELQQVPNRRLFMIKSRVFGYSKGEFLSNTTVVFERRLKLTASEVDYFQGKLIKEQPLVIMVEPMNGVLKPFDAVCINVHCYGNTWGEYRDELICQVKGMEAYRLKMLIQIVGHPIYFPMFNTQKLQKPTLRFQPLSYSENPVSKQIKVGNRSAIPLTVSWFVFLTKPYLREEEQAESWLDSNANFDSNHSGERSTESSKNYIAKNASKSAYTFPNSIEGRDFSQNSETFKSLPKSESSVSSSSTKKEKGELSEPEKEMSFMTSLKSSSSVFRQQLLPGRCDNNIFKVEPREIFFQPFEEKKITVTFDPHFCKPEEFPEEFQGVLTGCVKLKPEDEKCPGVFYRPCGINFVSELIDFNALVEIPLVSLEILKGDLKFLVDSNAIIKSENKLCTIRRKFLVKNTNQKSMCFTIEIIPGLIFKVKSVDTIDKFYPEYDPEVHNLKIEPGNVLEMELECSVTNKDVIYAFEDLKRNRKKEQCPDEIKGLQKSTNENEEEKTRTEPWMQTTAEFFNQKDANCCSLRPRDSFELNLNRMSPKSNNSVCWNGNRNEYGENEGEFFELPKPREFLCRPLPPKHMIVVQEEISFVQSELVTQTVVAELNISFPALRISKKSIDFGNVFLSETAIRYFSVINVTGFPTDFRVMAKMNAAEFAARPLTGSLPSCDYNLDIGKTITIEFKPSKSGYFREVYHIYANLDLEFDFYELFVSGFGTWNERYRSPKYETFTKLDGVYPDMQK